MPEKARKQKTVTCLLTQQKLERTDQKVRIVTGPKEIPDTGINANILFDQVGPYYAHHTTFIEQILNPLNCSGVPVERLISQCEQRSNRGIAFTFFIDEFTSLKLKPKQLAIFTSKIKEENLLHRILEADKHGVHISSKEGRA